MIRTVRAYRLPMVLKKTIAERATSSIAIRENTGISEALAESYYDGYNRALQDIAQNEQKLDYCLPDILQKIIPEKYSTNAELSKATGISQSALHHYVHGTRILTAKNLYKLSQALGVSADFLLTGGVNT